MSKDGYEPIISRFACITLLLSWCVRLMSDISHTLSQRRKVIYTYSFTGNNIYKHMNFSVNMQLDGIKGFSQNLQTRIPTAIIPVSMQIASMTGPDRNTGISVCWIQFSHLQGGSLGNRPVSFQQKVSDNGLQKPTKNILSLFIISSAVGIILFPGKATLLEVVYHRSPQVITK